MRIYPPIQQRLKDKILISENGCWEWQAYLTKDGYGKVKYNSKDYQAHRLSFEVFKHPIPNGLLACHTCDNTRCINPDHIFLGTHTDNIRDAMAKGRLPTVKHPSFSMYLYGCRCVECTKINREVGKRGHQKRELQNPLFLNNKEYV